MPRFSTKYEEVLDHLYQMEETADKLLRFLDGIEDMVDAFKASIEDVKKAALELTKDKKKKKDPGDYTYREWKQLTYEDERPVPK